VGKNKGLVIGIVVILLLVVGYFLMNKKGSSTTPGTSSLTPDGTTESKSLKDLLTAGIAQKCTYSSTDEDGSTEGTSYISGGKVRGDFSVVSSGKTTKSHMISDGKTSYIWTDGEETGFKMTVEETDTQETDSSQTPTQGAAGWDDKFDYKCSAWVTDGSYFTPPSNVKFTDFSELFKGNTPQ
jgi:hypothetical protein